MSFMLTLDDVSYTSKPTKPMIADITCRMQAAGPAELDAAGFCQHVKLGRTWCGGCYSPSAQGWGEFVGQQVFALDFDNDAEVIMRGQRVKDADGHTVKRALFPGEDGYLAPVDALDRCERLGLEPLCLYFTMRSKGPAWLKYRVVFDMDELLDDEATAKGVIQSLLTAFPEADRQCGNCNRLYFGSGGEVWETWRLWGVA